tara:strand:- start:513 stop:2246 length:1734 start_codon:yes stop_codon:yes gene_type:complete
MDTQIKVSSNEGGVFTAANNRCSFTLSGNTGHYDLSSAYVNLICSIPVTAEEERSATTAGANPFNEGVGTINYNTNSTANGRGVYILKARMQDDGGVGRDFDYQNAVVVKNINMKCSNFGSIERCKRNDIYASSINAYSKNMADRVSDSYKNLFKVSQISNSFDSLFADLNKEGNVSSRNIQRQSVKIPLKDMLGFANVKQYDTGKFGQTDIDLELNLDKIVSTNLFGQNTNLQLPLGNDEFNQAMGSQNLFQCINLTAAIGPDMTQVQIGSSQTAHRVFQRLEDCPYYVGQKVYVAATYTKGTDPQNRNGTTNVLLVTRRITAITYNRGDGIGMVGAVNNLNSITLTLNAALEGSTALTNDGTYTNVRLRGAECTLGAFQVDFAELEIKQINPNNVVNDGGLPIDYKSYDTEEFSTPAVRNFRRIFECPSNAHNLFIANTSLTAGGNGTNGVVSRLEEIQDYRLRVDNKDCSDRPIRMRDTAAAGVNAPTQDPLHLQKLIVAFKNSNKSLRSLQERYQNANDRSGLFRNKYNTDSVVIGQVLPVTDKPKQVQVEINTGTNGITGLTLFKEVVKTIG